MAHMDLIDSLIATYRTLNLRVRPLDPATAGQLSAGGTTLRAVIAELRDQELTASQTLKNMTLADTVVLEEFPLIVADAREMQAIQQTEEISETIN